MAGCCAGQGLGPATLPRVRALFVRLAILQFIFGALDIAEYFLFSELYGDWYQLAFGGCSILLGALGVLIWAKFANRLTLIFYLVVVVARYAFYGYLQYLLLTNPTVHQWASSVTYYWYLAFAGIALQGIVGVLYVYLIIVFFGLLHEEALPIVNPGVQYQRLPINRA